MIEQSESIASLAAAFAKAQATIEGAVKGKVNPAFRSKYADLASVWDACREQLSTNGLAVMQFPGEVVDGRMTLTTQLTHESGEWMRSTMSVPLAKADPQGAGSALTYARRYALAAVVGVCPEDDDGNAASRPASQPRQEQAQPRADPTPGKFIDEGQRQQIMTLMTAKNIEAREFCTVGEVSSIPELPASKFAAAMKWLTSQPKRELAGAGAGASTDLDDEIPY